MKAVLVLSAVFLATTLAQDSEHVNPIQNAPAKGNSMETPNNATQGNSTEGGMQHNNGHEIGQPGGAGMEEGDTVKLTPQTGEHGGHMGGAGSNENKTNETKPSAPGSHENTGPPEAGESRQKSAASPANLIGEWMKVLAVIAMAMMWRMG